MDVGWSLLYHGMVAVVLLAALASLTTGRHASRTIIVLALVGIAAGLAWAWMTYPFPYDFKRFWRIGNILEADGDPDALLNPRDEGDRQMILNPPTVLPLFRIWPWRRYPRRPGSGRF